MQLEGRVVIVTGASRGIGEATARAVAWAGARVVLVARSGAAVEDHARSIREGGGQALAVACDVTREADVARMVEVAVDAFGGIGGVVNNAGFLGPRVSLGEYPAEAFREALEVNAVGTFLVTREALPWLRRAPDAFVVNVSSYLGRYGAPGCVGYVAGKYAVEGVTAGLAAEVEGGSIAVVSVGPGMVGTEMLQSYLGTDDVEGHRTPQEAGRALSRLLAELGLADNGAVLDLDY